MPRSTVAAMSVASGPRSVAPESVMSGSRSVDGVPPLPPLPPSVHTVPSTRAVAQHLTPHGWYDEKVMAAQRRDLERVEEVRDVV